MKILTKKEIIEFIKDAEKNGRVALYDSIGGKDNDIYDSYKSYKEWEKENNEEFINLFNDDIYKIYTAYLKAVNILQSITEEELKMFNNGKDVKKREFKEYIEYSLNNGTELIVDKKRNIVMIYVKWVRDELTYTFKFKYNSLEFIQKEVYEDVFVMTKFYK